MIRFPGEAGVADGIAVRRVVLGVGTLREDIIRFGLEICSFARIKGPVEGIGTDKEIRGHEIVMSFEFQGGGKRRIIADQFKTGADAKRKIPVGRIAESSINFEVVLVIEACLFIDAVIGGDIELIELSAQVESEFTTPAEILKMLGSHPEVLPDIEGYQASGSGREKIAAGQIENGADPAE